MKRKIKRNSGAVLWDDAKRIIPGGNQLLSKRSELFLPDQWPSYYQKAEGCKIKDMDGRWFRDFSIMGIGACSLGYSNPEVNEAVISSIKKGSMSTLNCFEELELAEALIRKHPWAGGVRFTRSGGESCSVAVRIARSFAKKDIVLFSGYHGWHDWYLATNLADKKNLNKQLLPGLEPKGVPTSLSGTVFPFNSGDVDTFDKYIKSYRDKIGAVMMEIWRYGEPDLEFIRHVQNKCIENNIVLIFDEISSGFRISNAGSHSIWGLEPDICVLGKALGNGHPIGAIIGKSDVMDAAQTSFISSTYWTERVGYVAGLKVLEIFERDKVIDLLRLKGQKIRKGIESIISEFGMPIRVIGVPSVIILIFEGENNQEMKTLFTQEMLKKGFLAGNIIYVSIAHSDEDIAHYIQAARDTFSFLSDINPNDLKTHLAGPVSHTGFQRLN